MVAGHKSRGWRAQYTSDSAVDPSLTGQIPWCAPKQLAWSSACLSLFSLQFYALFCRMNNTTKTVSVDEKVWEHHRSTIEILYWEKSLNRIEAHMKECHGFVAT
jgi:hypothetical protein